MSRSRSTGILIVIVAFAIAAGFFVYPHTKIFGVGVFPLGVGEKFSPWRLGLDLVGGSHLIYEVDMSRVSDSDRDAVMNGLRDVVERRVDLFGVAEPQVRTAFQGGSHRIIVELAGVELGEAVREIGATPVLDFREAGEVEIDGETVIDFVHTELTGRYVRGAQLTFDPNTNQPAISIEFDSEGAIIFERLTEKNMGLPLAIFLDDQSISVPVVQEKISGGKAQITGRFTVAEARQLVERFNAGALPAPINLVSQTSVGATLGSVSLEQAIFAGLIGTIAIIIFMLLYYRYLGIFSALALIIYMVLTLAVFKGISMTMTLAGIAGFILSIGMAIDANILVFERTKEEIKRGLSRPSAVEEGFKRAWSSIRDSNITTMLGAVILYYFSSGFVQGFALALFVGVLMSMFSAITVTKSFLRVFIK